MGRASKRAQVIRTLDEFSASRLKQVLKEPTQRTTIYAWTLAQIFAARDAQLRGDFQRAAKLAESMRTDDALAVAYENRLAPQRCIRVKIEPSKKPGSAKIANEAEALFGQDGVGIHPDTVSDIHGCLVNHGVAFAYNVATPREDGSRIDFELHYWPIEHVRWDPLYRVFRARVDPSTSAADVSTDPELGPAMTNEIPIVHGDGRWVVFKKHEIDPFKQEAAILPAAIVWARHAYACRDWAKASVAHGNAKMVGELPPGVAIREGEGAAEKLTKESVAFAEMMVAIAATDAPVGIRPSGSKTEFLTNTSTAWQVFNELVQNAERAAARIYLGTDGILGAQGGAPGVDVEALFGVAATRVEGDLRAIERGIFTGVIEPWCAMNFGDSSLAPQRLYEIPDADEEAKADSMAKRRAAFHADVKAARDNGFEVNQEYIDKAAEDHGIDAPTLPKVEADAPKAPAIALAPTDIAKVVTVNEARASSGLGKLVTPDGKEDPDGALTLDQFSLKKAAQAAAPPAPAALRSVS